MYTSTLQTLKIHSNIKNDSELKNLNISLEALSSFFIIKIFVSKSTCCNRQTVACKIYSCLNCVFFYNSNERSRFFFANVLQTHPTTSGERMTVFNKNFSSLCGEKRNSHETCPTKILTFFLFLFSPKSYSTFLKGQTQLYDENRLIGIFFLLLLSSADRFQIQ